MTCQQDLSPEQIKTDQLWELFWDQTNVDWCDWFYQRPVAMDPMNDDQPLGWVEFRDQGLAGVGF